MINALLSIFDNLYTRFFRYLIYKLEWKVKVSRLGSNYGGWSFINDDNLIEKTVISGGVGEDISFDIEFLNLYKGKVIFVDPTPRALTHIENVIRNLGESKSVDYSLDGNQSCSSYDLKNLNTSQFIVEPYALFNKDFETVNFFPPKNNNHVSFSISNWQNVSELDENRISVETITIKSLMEKYKIDHVPLIKLDIEGAAENQVLPNILKQKILPDQILVEFDELHNLKFYPYFKCTILIFKLLFHGYVLIQTNKFPDMLFVKKRLLRLTENI